MGSLRENFKKFDRENPRVYQWFRSFAMEALSNGFEKLSADMVIHRVRWEVKMKTKSIDDFKISNNHVAFYARKFMDDFPDYKGFFNTKNSAADRPEPGEQARLF